MLPRKLVTACSPSLRRLFALADEGITCLEAYRSSMPKGDNASPVIFDSLQHLPDHAIGAEAVGFLVAGSDTTAFTLTSAVWHICHNPMIKRKLAAAIKEAIPEHREGEYPTLMQLESIPYLVACVKESLRIAIPVPGRLPRVVPGATAAPLVVDGKVVPPGSIVGMSAYSMHISEELWGPNARDFEPERWLGEGAKGLDEHSMAFSKGARNCIGQPLAQAELLLTLYMLFRYFDMELDAASGKGFTTKDQFVTIVQEPGVVLRMRRL
jgi:cytochrome P450